VHPWFREIDWDRIYEMEAAYVPQVNDDLDTQNFEKFDEVYDLLCFTLSFIIIVVFFPFFGVMCVTGWIAQ
jgi:serine/threonine kinase 38